MTSYNRVEPTDHERAAARAAAARSSILLGCTCTYEVVVETWQATKLGLFTRRQRRASNAEVYHHAHCPALKFTSHHQVTVPTPRPKGQR